MRLLREEVSDFEIDPACLTLRRARFPSEITFYTPGFKRFRTSEFGGQVPGEFVSISVTGGGCALGCEHCKGRSLRGMVDLPSSGKSLYELCAVLASGGARGVLISGGSDRSGRVPLLHHLEDLRKIRRELSLIVRIHSGLLDEPACDGLAGAGVDAVMFDLIGDRRTIRDVYHLDASPDDYEFMLERLEERDIPVIPHIILGHYYGRIRGEKYALQMVTRHPPESLVILILTPLEGTPMAASPLPSVSEIGEFFAAARNALAAVPIMLGCARPSGPMKLQIDRLAILAGFNGIAYPAEGIVEFACTQQLSPSFVSACCGIHW